MRKQSTLTGYHEEKWRAIYNHYNRPLYYRALQAMRNPQDAEDAVQITFIKIANNLEKIEDVYSKETYNYIVTILQNSIRDVFRKRKAHPEIELSEIENRGGLEDSSQDIETMVLAKAQFQDVLECIDDLEEKYRLPLLLRYVNDYDLDQIAAIMKISKSTVSMRIHRAKKILKKLVLQKEGDSSYERA